MKTTPILISLALGVLLAACGEEPTPQPQARAEKAPVAVQVEDARLDEVAGRLPVVGAVRARNEVVVSARIVGYIRTIAAEEGGHVPAGQTLVTIDDRELQSGVAAAEAAKTAARTAIAATEQQVATAEANLHLAELTHRRFSDLLGKQSVAQQEFDEVEARWKSAKAAVALAESQKAQAEARLAQAEAALAQAEVALDYAVVRAPVTGVVTERMVDPGALAAPGAPLLRIEQAGAYRLEVAAPESLAPSLVPGQTVPVAIDALGDGGPSEGRIVEIVPTVDAASRTFTVKIALDGVRGARSGQYGRAFFPSEPSERLTVPRSAVVERGQLRFVFVADGDRARRRAVTVGDEADGRSAILSGLDEGDRVIVKPGDIRDGDPVAAGGASR